MFRPQFSGFSLFLLYLLILGNGSSANPMGKQKSGKSSVFSLFNLKEKSRFWSESVLRSGFDDLESSNPGKLDFVNYTRAGNIANYLNLLEVESIYLPMPVNFVFIGFEGKGNKEFMINAEELERWFTKIDHVFEHTRIPKIGESLSPFYKISVDREQGHSLPLISHISYNFSVHAIQMGEKVTAIFERAINVLGRRDNVSSTRDDGNSVWQVDVDMMSIIFTSLVEYLQLEDAYNIFILNPKRDIKMAKYGYRRGLSVSEINFLKENKPLQTSILQSGSTPDIVLALDKIKKPLYEKHPMAKFAWTITEESHTMDWHNGCLDALSNIEQLYQGKGTADVIQSKVLQILNGKNDDLKLLSQKAKSGDFNGFHADCLTDTWIGNQRWAFIDLTAGPFSWGPSVGGEGVRTGQSLPNVEKKIGAVTEISEDEAEVQLQEAIQEKFAVLGENDHHAINILLAEIDIYELFAFKHCKGRKVKLPLCEELDERMEDLKNELHSYEGEEYEEKHKRKAIEALKRMENWNLFSDTHEDFQNYTVARDTFLSHLGATLWGSLRHIISPSLADGAFHYYETITFQLFFITQEKVRSIKHLPVDLKSLKDGLSSIRLNSQQVQFSQDLLSLSEDPALAMAFSVARRAAAVPLLLVNGTYRKTVRSYLDSAILQYQLQRLKEHASLKGSHARSRSTLEIPIFWFILNGTLLIDKHYQAKALSDMVVVVQSELSSWESHLHCNGEPLLWDLRRPTKAALAAVSEHVAGLHPLHFVYSEAHETAIEMQFYIEKMRTKDIAILNLDPISRSHATKWLIQTWLKAHFNPDWIWSVGCNPLSITSQGWQMSQFQHDTIARSYVLTTVEESILLVNSAIHLLVMEQTTEQTFKLFKSQERELLNKYNYVISLWRRISTLIGELRYVDALRLLHTLEDASKLFADYVNATVASLHPIHCTMQRKVEVEFDVTTIPAFLVVILVLWFLLKPRRPKPKIN